MVRQKSRISTLDFLLDEYQEKDDIESRATTARKSHACLDNEQFFKKVIGVWGLQETVLRQSIYFSFVASRVETDADGTMVSFDGESNNINDTGSME